MYDVLLVVGTPGATPYGGSSMDFSLVELNMKLRSAFLSFVPSIDVRLPHNFCTQKTTVT